MQLNDQIEKIVETDVLIIGGGTAACVAAIEAAKQGAKATLIDKRKFGWSGSSANSDGETTAVIDPTDSIERYLRETVEGGEFLGDQELAEILATECTNALKELDSYGVPYVKRKNGDFAVYRELGMSRPRTPPVKGGGPAFIGALKAEAIRRGVEIFEWTIVHKLLTSDAKVQGALALNCETGKHLLIQSKSTIIAAGSCTALYPYASAGYRTTGDAFALAFDAGAELINMEFIEFTVIPAPRSAPLSTSGIKPLTGRGALFYNQAGERFMLRYDPEKAERTKRSTLVLGLYKEIQSGRGPVYMDATVIPSEEWELLEDSRLGILKKLRACHIDYRTQKFQWISPAIHTFLGGIRINEKCETNVSGLYSCGESSGQVYGADRVGTYLTWCAVSGRRAGLFAAKKALSSPKPSVNQDQIGNEIERIKEITRRRGSLPDEIMARIHEIATCVGPIRNGKALNHALEELNFMKNNGMMKPRADDGKMLIQALEAENLALVAEMVIRCAAFRTESRGQHQRDDYPSRDDSNWLKWILIRRKENEITIHLENIPFERYKLKPYPLLC